MDKMENSAAELRAERIKQTSILTKGNVSFSTGKPMCFSETAQNKGSPTVVLESQLILSTLTFTFLVHQFLFSALSISKYY